MFGRINREILTAALIAAVFGLSACGGGSVSPSAGEPPGAQQLATTPNAFACLSNPCLYVANFYGSTVTIYSLTAKGNAKPLHTIAGSKTGLVGPYGVAVDAGHNASVVNTNGGPSSTGSVTVYKAGANGNVAPTRTISGSSTGLFYPFGIALDSSKETYVTNYNGQSVTVYAASAKGNVAPIRTISGSNTGLDYPEGIVLSGGRKTYVANSSGASVTVYSAGANGNVSPIQTISGSKTGLNQPQGIALGGGKIYVANFSGSVTVYTTGENGNVPPVQTISGSKTRLNEPFGIAVVGSALYVANESNNSLTVYPATANGNVAPVRTISGSNTGLNGPAGILPH